MSVPAQPGQRARKQKPSSFSRLANMEFSAAAPSGVQLAVTDKSHHNYRMYRQQQLRPPSRQQGSRQVCGDTECTKKQSMHAYLQIRVAGTACIGCMHQQENSAAVSNSKDRQQMLYAVQHSQHLSVTCTHDKPCCVTDHAIMSASKAATRH